MDIDLLISAVLNRKALWDQRDPLHHNRFILDKLWDEVAKETASTRQCVRNKWKSLRDNFRRELQKKPNPRSGDDGSVANWKSPWKNFESLLFLKDQFTVRSAGGSLPIVASDSLEMDFGDPMPDEGTSQTTTSPSDTPSSAGLPRVTDRTETPTPATKKIKRPRDEIGSALIRLEEKKLEFLERSRAPTPSKEDDDDVAFFNSLLPHVKSLPPTEKLLLRIRIQQLVYEFVSKTHQQQVSTFPPQHQYGHSTTFQGTSNQQQEQSYATMMSPQDASNPPSVASYFSQYSDDG